MALDLDAGAEGAEGVEVRVEPAAADHVAARRRHRDGAEAAEQRAGAQERGADAARELGVDRRVRRHVLAQSETTFSSSHARTPMPWSRPTIASTSRMRGILRRTTSSSVRRVAASTGNAAFLFPAGTIVPDNGTPPSMTNLSIREAAQSWSGRGGARVPKLISPIFGGLCRSPAGAGRFGSHERGESGSGLGAVLRVDRVRLAAKACPAVEASMVAYARKFGEDEELWAATGILHDLDYEKYPDLETGHPRYALKELEEKGYPPELIDAVAGPRALPRRGARDAAGEDPLRRRRAVRLRRRGRAGAARRASTA